MRTKQLQFWNRCRPENQPSSKRWRRDAHCHRAWQATCEAKALVEAPDAFIQAITKIIQDKQNHPVIAQMISPEVNDDPPPSERAASSSGGHGRRGAVTRPLHSHMHNSNKCQRQREILTFVTHRKPALELQWPRLRCYWSTWGPHVWPVHPWPREGGEYINTSLVYYTLKME